VRVGARCFDGRAKLESDLGRIADYPERQMTRRKWLCGAALRIEGLPCRPTRRDLEGLARKWPLVAIRPVADRGLGSAALLARRGTEERDHV
jgi:hypothetical protein